MTRSVFCVSASWLFTLLFSTISATPHYRRQNQSYNQSCSSAFPQTVLAAPVVFGDGTYPRANKLADGSLIGAYTAFVDGNNVITLVKSYDNGNTWSFQGTAASGASNAHDIDNPYPLELPSGRLIVAFRNHDRDPSTGNYTYFRITLSYSDDGGLSWEFLSQAAEAVGPVTGLWEPFLRLTTTTTPPTLQIYYSSESSPQDQNTLSRSSPDSGCTWSAAQPVTGATTTSRDGMSGIATLAGPNLLLVYECEQPNAAGNPIFTVRSAASADDGATWADTRDLVYAASGVDNNAGSPQIAAVPSAVAGAQWPVLVVVFMTDEDTGGHVWVQGSAVKMVVSVDGGGSWGGEVEVGPVQSNWPGVLGLGTDAEGKGEVLVLFENGGSKVVRVTIG